MGTNTYFVYFEVVRLIVMSPSSSIQRVQINIKIINIFINIRIRELGIRSFQKLETMREIFMQKIIKIIIIIIKAVSGKLSINSLQKTAIHGTSHIIWKVLQCEA